MIPLASQQYHRCLAAIPRRFAQQIEAVALAEMVVYQVDVVPVALDHLPGVLVAGHPLQVEAPVSDFGQQILGYNVVILVVIDQKYPDWTIVHLSLPLRRVAI